MVATSMANRKIVPTDNLITNTATDVARIEFVHHRETKCGTCQQPSSAGEASIVLDKGVTNADHFQSFLLALQTSSHGAGV